MLSLVLAVSAQDGDAMPDMPEGMMGGGMMGGMGGMEGMMGGGGGMMGGGMEGMMGGGGMGGMGGAPGPMPTPAAEPAKPDPFASLMG